MSEQILAKLTSRKWLKEAIAGRLKNLINSFAFAPSTIEREVAGEKHLFYLGNVTGKSWYSKKSDLSFEMRFVKNELIRPSAVVIECGAHHGGQTVLLSRWVGAEGKVIAIEPIPENIAILKKNIELNGLTNVTVIEKAVGSNCGKLSMHPRSNASVSSKEDSRSTINVESVTLDSVAEEFNIAPTFIKIDVEGYEYQILDGAKSIIKTTPAIFVEVHTLTLPRYGRRFEDLWGLVDQNLYDIFIQSDDFAEPVKYARDAVPGGRVHLFFRPRNRR